MITRQDVLKGQPCPPEYEENLLDLLIKVNKVDDACGMINEVTSGLRTMKHHLEIYAQKGIPKDKVPLKSKHLYCQAVDISDPNGKLYSWCQKNEDLVRTIGLWIEIKDTEKRVHFQNIPFGSYKPGGTIFFKP